MKEKKMNKTLSISPEPFSIDSARIDILDENIDTINNISGCYCRILCMVDICNRK